MILLTPELQQALRDNYANRHGSEARGERFDPLPVIKLFNPVGAATWLATELAEDGDGVNKQAEHARKRPDADDRDENDRDDKHFQRAENVEKAAHDVIHESTQRRAAHQIARAEE